MDRTVKQLKHVAFVDAFKIGRVCLGLNVFRLGDIFSTNWRSQQPNLKPYFGGETQLPTVPGNGLIRSITQPFEPKMTGVSGVTGGAERDAQTDAHQGTIVAVIYLASASSDEDEASREHHCQVSCFR